MLKHKLAKHENVVNKLNKPLNFIKNLFGKQKNNDVVNFIVATVNDKIMPIDRGEIYEDPLEKLLKANGIGEVTASGNVITGKGIDKAPPTKRPELMLDVNVLKQYIGTYEIQPGFNIVVSVKVNKIYGQATGKGEFELFAEEKDKLFLKVVAADLHFYRNAEGIVESLTLFQGGQEMPGKKVD